MAYATATQGATTVASHLCIVARDKYKQQCLAILCHSLHTPSKRQVALLDFAKDFGRLREIDRMKGYFAILFCALFIVTGTSGQALTMMEFARILSITMKDIRRCIHHSNLSDMDMTKLDTVMQGRNISQETMNDILINLGCFAACILDKSDIMQNDAIQLDKLIDSVNRHNVPINDEMKEKLNTCAVQAKEETDKCKSGVIFASCLLEELTKRSK
ncbi:PREDICTED: uncharacterized protein LOC108554786 [Eufriesea mexicana]|uniref:uncharacterized protein LOC108554786 n=1 Tax=Eufriesea mexicana TaxID=516756 RepID=UPI00083C1770|nr:PREDICTED: uncharacterized protein LOC108554786 [Eufriesea mexicana]